jgi:hypothetical protein
MYIYFPEIYYYYYNMADARNWEMEARFNLAFWNDITNKILGKHKITDRANILKAVPRQMVRA